MLPDPEHFVTRTWSNLHQTRLFEEPRLFELNKQPESVVRHITGVCSMYFALKVETKLQNTWWYTAWSTWNNKRATLRRRSVRHERITSCKKNRVIWPQQKKKEAEGKWEVDARCAQLKWHGNWSRVHREGMCLMKCNNTVPVGPLPLSQWISGYVLWLECHCSTTAMLLFFLSIFGCLFHHV